MNQIAYSPGDSVLIFLPIIIVISIHLIILLPSLLCFWEKKLEFFFMGFLLAILSLEMVKFETAG